jgi:hypothetical protein
MHQSQPPPPLQFFATSIVWIFPCDHCKCISVQDRPVFGLLESTIVVRMHAMKAYGGFEDLAAVIHSLDTRWSCVISLTFWLL